MEIDEESEKELETVGWKGSVELLTPLGSPTQEPQWVTGGCQLDRSETMTTTDICPAISGTTPYSPCWVSPVGGFVYFKPSSQLTAGTALLNAEEGETDRLEAKQLRMCLLSTRESGY